MSSDKLQRRQSKITIPTRAHPLAKMVFAEAKRQRVTYEELEWRSGCLRSTIKQWRRCNRPGLESIEATLGALGWQVTVAPAEYVVPDQLRADLKALAEKHGLQALPALEYVAQWSGFSWPGCPLEERRRRNQQIEERLAA